MRTNVIPLKGQNMANNAVIETVTPERAKMWLEKNTSNRPLHPRDINRIAETIKSGQWELNGETIKFSEDGTLLDGQHRLHGIIQAGKAVQTYVVRGLADVYNTIDTGAKRTGRDVVARLGEANPTVLAGAARIWYLHNELKEGYLGTMSQWATLTNNQDIVKTVERYPGLKDSVSAVLGKGKVKPYLSPSIGAYLHFYFGQIDSTMAQVFFDKLVTGDDLTANHPILHLRNRLVTISGETKEGRIKKVALTIKAWNFFRQNKYTKSLDWRSKDEDFPTAK